jgi:hypothetical protein
MSPQVLSWDNLVARSNFETLHYWPASTVIGFGENKLSGSGRIQSFQNCCSSERTKKGSPETFLGEISTYSMK